MSTNDNITTPRNNNVRALLCALAAQVASRATEFGLLTLPTSPVGSKGRHFRKLARQKQPKRYENRLHRCGCDISYNLDLYRLQSTFRYVLRCCLSRFREDVFWETYACKYSLFKKHPRADDVNNQPNLNQNNKNTNTNTQ